MPNGIYYVGVQVDDGTNPPVTSYAIGQVTVTSSSMIKELNLGDLGNSVKGCTFEGMSFMGHLGQVMTGRFDMLSASGTPDNVSDFALVAPMADSHYSEDPEVGEVYVIFGWDSRFVMRSSAWYNGGRINVNQVGSDPDVPGFIAVGPSYITKSLGITAIQPLADLDTDLGSELMFGMPLLLNGVYEAQDYDPEPSGVLGANGMFLNAPHAYPPAPAIPQPDYHDWYGGRVWSSGYIAVLASSTPGLYNSASSLGGVMHIDEIGAAPGDPFRRDPHPRSIRYLQSGVRVYPHARPETNFDDFLNNDYRFGQDLGIEDLDGDGTPDWLIAAPQNANDAGQIDIGYSSLAWLWTQALPATATSYSWPYMIAPNNIDRYPLWPFGLIDNLRGDKLKAPSGHLGNPTGVGDFNGDRIGDIAASTPASSNSGLRPNAGAAYLVFGRAPFGDHSVGEIKDPVVLNALPGIAIYGTAAGDRVGEKMTALGRPNYGMVGHPRLRDFNGDGIPDWVISAPGRASPDQGR
ncbi:MAG: FG-GAP repeat protein [Myxococcales bacterium]